MPLNARSVGLAGQPGIPPHGRTSGTPSSQRMKILTKITVRQSCSRERRTLLFYLAHPAYHALLHTKHANNSPTTRDTHIRMPLDGDPWVLPAKPDIPPMAAPPEASYRRPEDNIVLSHMPRITRGIHTNFELKNMPITLLIFEI